MDFIGKKHQANVPDETSNYHSERSATKQFRRTVHSTPGIPPRAHALHARPNYLG